MGHPADPSLRMTILKMHGGRTPEGVLHPWNIPHNPAQTKRTQPKPRPFVAPLSYHDVRVILSTHTL